MPNKKYCFKCELSKAEDRFRFNPLTNDGLSVVCTDCDTPQENKRRIDWATAQLKRRNIRPCSPIVVQRAPVGADD